MDYNNTKKNNQHKTNRINDEKIFCFVDNKEKSK